MSDEDHPPEPLPSLQAVLHDPARARAALPTRAEEASAVRVATMTLPPLEPRSSTIDAIDNARAALDHARRAVLDEVAYLGSELDRLRKEYAQMKAERDQAIAELKEVLRGSSR